MQQNDEILGLTMEEVPFDVDEIQPRFAAMEEAIHRICDEHQMMLAAVIVAKSAVNTTGSSGSMPAMKITLLDAPWYAPVEGEPIQVSLGKMISHYSSLRSTQYVTRIVLSELDEAVSAYAKQIAEFRTFVEVQQLNERLSAPKE